MTADKSLIASMTLDEKIEWLEALWASLESEADFQSVPDWHQELIERRLKRMREQPTPGMSVDELFTKLASRKK
ncbi:MAG: addiction module protein [Planctomycetes bacterium]|nr:addiction module protein [Planctomycetota bacterium]MCB9934843.1 addiction module protein [Planctomycetota bacterium]